jgi:hypothetical protein
MTDKNAQNYWICVSKGGALVREGSSFDSPLSLTQLEYGDIVLEEAIEGNRLKFKGGWASFVSQGGNVLLEKFNQQRNVRCLTIGYISRVLWHDKGTMPLDLWNLLKEERLEKANYMCEICHCPGGLVCHQIWENEVDSKNKSLLVLFRGVEILCWRCHDAQHFGWSICEGRNEIVLRHMRQYNNWNYDILAAYLANWIRNDKMVKMGREKVHIEKTVVNIEYLYELPAFQHWFSLNFHTYQSDHENDHHDMVIEYRKLGFKFGNVCLKRKGGYNRHPGRFQKTEYYCDCCCDHLILPSRERNCFDPLVIESNWYYCKDCGADICHLCYLREYEFDFRDSGLCSKFHSNSHFKILITKLDDRKKLQSSSLSRSDGAVTLQTNCASSDVSWRSDNCINNCSNNTGNSRNYSDIPRENNSSKSNSRVNSNICNLSIQKTDNVTWRSNNYTNIGHNNHINRTNYHCQGNSNRNISDKTRHDNSSQSSSKK